MPLDFLKKGGDNNSENISNEDFVELDAQSAEGDEKVTVRAATLKEFDEIEEIQGYLRDDNIVWINIKPLKDRDMTKLKRAINRLKKTIKAIDGDMAGVDEEWIVATPEYAKIARTGDKIEDN